MDVRPRPPVDWIALNLLPGMGPIALRAALAHFGDPREIAYRVPAGTLRQLPGVHPDAGKIRQARRSLTRRAAAELARCEKLGARVVPADHPDYPAALTELPDAPVLLYWKGEIRPGVLRVAVVGSRTPTAYGRRVANGLAAGLGAREIEVVSGGARGIDSCAHRGALAEEGRTIAVLGTGLARTYPPENEPLFEEIARNGAVVTEFPLDAGAVAGHFPRRNRLISALSQAVVVVEAAERSGSLITARFAADQGREVLAVPGPVHSSRSAGCHRLIQDGAKLVQKIDDILAELPPLFRAAAAGDPSCDPEPNLADSSPDEVTLLELLDPIEPLHIDELAEKVPFGIGRLQAALLGLEVRAAVEQTPGRYYLSRPRRDS